VPVPAPVLKPQARLVLLLVQQQPLALAGAQLHHWAYRPLPR
jgi:hypothetical protein